MKTLNSSHRSGGHCSRAGVRWPWLVAIAALIVLLAVLVPRPGKIPSGGLGPTGATEHGGTEPRPPRPAARLGGRHGVVPPGLTAEQVVSNKLSRFVRYRRQVMRDMAKKFKVEVPAKFEQFFDVVEAGHWEEIRDQFEALAKIRHETGSDEAGTTLWPVVMETYGVAETAHDWPAQQLLDYGDAVLGSLRPDMVYVGGTGPGRLIPTLLNETSDGDRHVVLTQNALADASYLQYVSFLYSDRFAALTTADSENCFKAYLSDARARFDHDQQFPDEAKQLLPGESVQVAGDRVQLSGQVAVMAINERLLQTLMEKNPNLSFAIEQSFPFKSMYGDTTPLGPIMELRVQDPQNALTAARATETVDYWNSTSQQLLSGLAANDSADVRKAYAKMAAEQAALLLARNYPAQAEEDFRYASQICPSSPETVFNYVSLLLSQNRAGEAMAIAENAVHAAPDNAQFGQLLAHLKSLAGN